MARGCALLAALLMVSAGPAAAQEATLTYTVQASDKLIRLGERILRSPADWPEVARFNDLPDANRLQPGQTLRIPLRLLRSRGAPVRVVDVHGDVRAGGQPLAAGATLQEGAALTSAAGSSAVLELADGSRIQVMPQSRLEFPAHRHYLLPETGKTEDASWFASTLRLAQGALEAVADKAVLRAEPLKVLTPTGLVGIRGTHFRVGTASGFRPFTRTEVLQGRVNADNPAQNARADVDAGRGARIDPRIRGIVLVPLLPRPDLSGVPAEVRLGQARVPLPALGGAESLHVQVATDASFQRIVTEGTVLSGGFSLEGLAPGEWLLRVRAVDRNGIEGFDADRRVTLLAA